MAATHVRQAVQVGPVTAVIPCYNCASSLERAVSSVAAQTVRPAELLVVDDASTDSTRQVIAEMRNRYGADWIRLIELECNAGPATARNTAWNAARQSYIAFLDADDAWHEGKLEAQLAYMQAHQDVVLTAHTCMVIRHGEARGSNTTLRGVRRLTCRSLLLSNRIATRTVMLKRELPYRFRDGKRYAEDYLLWLQLACDGHRMELFDAELAYVFKSAFGEGGLSASLWKMEQGELAVYWQLENENRLSYLTAFLCSIFSLLKFVRRAAIVMIMQFRAESHLHAR